MLKTLRKLRARKDGAARLYAAIVTRARTPVFYTQMGVPDTIDGRFDLLALHAWLVLDRLRDAGLNDLSQALTDTLFIGFEEGMRDLGTGDMGMGRKLKAFADAFYGRLAAYDAARDDAAAMTTAVVRNLYRGTDNAHAAAVARYALDARARLARQDLGPDAVAFGPLP
jgi:cytochrome b pre-mRNA-processing protein 3